MIQLDYSQSYYNSDCDSFNKIVALLKGLKLTKLSPTKVMLEVSIII